MLITDDVFITIIFDINCYFNDLSDVDECVLTPCSNGGTCQNTMGSYLCNCPAGWIGRHCDVGTDRKL